MANTKSAKKSIKVQERRRVRNQMIDTRVRSFFKKARRAIEEVDSENAEKTVVQAISQMDKAVAKGIIHKNTAARKKSRLMKHFRAMG